MSIAPEQSVTLTRVVIAEDDAPLRKMLRRRLELTGEFDVVGEAADGPEAVDMVERHQPDVAVIDYAMPGMTGDEVVDCLRRVAPHTRTVLLSGFDCTSRWAGTAAPDAFVPKGSRMSTLIEVLRELGGGAAGLFPSPTSVARRAQSA